MVHAILRDVHQTDIVETWGKHINYNETHGVALFRGRDLRVLQLAESSTISGLRQLGNPQ